MATVDEDAAFRMERMYRWQKHLYDLTRKYYLFGRDRLIRELDLQPGDSLLDIGCGTGRNLELIAYRYPEARLYGLDAADAMLEVARKRLARAGVHDRVTVAFGLAGEGDELAIFGRDEPVDRVVFSYSLSMFDDPATAITSALRTLKPGGRLHIVDFGLMADLPRAVRQALTTWLAKFHVFPTDVPRATLAAAVDRGEGEMEVASIMGGYATLLTFVTAAARP